MGAVARAPVAEQDGFEVEVDRVTPVSWSSMLKAFSDSNIYQTWAYGAVRWGSGNLSHLVLRRGGEVVAIAQLRIIRPIKVRFGVAYVRWGPLCQRRGEELNPKTVQRMADALREEYVVKRGLLLRILPNAFGGSRRAGVFRSGFSSFSFAPRKDVNRYRTFVLDLGPSLEELRRNLDKKWRNQLTRAEKNGLGVSAGRGADEYRVFAGLYSEMRRRKNFETTVNVEEFARIQEDLAEADRMMIWICAKDGAPVSAIVLSAMGDSAEYLLGATGERGLDLKGAYLLQWTAVQWLKQNGFRWYDLGGIDPERNPGVYHFKRGLSGTDASHIGELVACDGGIATAIINLAESARNIVIGGRSRLRLLHHR